MAATVSLSSLINAVQLRADNHRLTTAQLTGFVNAAYTQLYDKLTEAFAEDYNLSMTTVTTVASVSTISLPADHYKLRGLDLNYQGTQYLALKPFVWKDRNLYTNANLYGFLGPYYRYHIQGQSIVLTPTPTAVQTIRISYTPVPTLMVATTDTIDGVAGWEELVILQAARMCMINEETDTSQIERQIAEVSARIDKMAASRNTGTPTVVAAMSESQGQMPINTGVLGAPGGWDDGW